MFRNEDLVERAGSFPSHPVTSHGARLGFRGTTRAPTLGAAQRTTTAEILAERSLRKPGTPLSNNRPQTAGGSVGGAVAHEEMDWFLGPAAAAAAAAAGGVELGDAGRTSGEAAASGRPRTSPSLGGESNNVRNSATYQSLLSNGRQPHQKRLNNYHVEGVPGACRPMAYGKPADVHSQSSKAVLAEDLFGGQGVPPSPKAAGAAGSNGNSPGRGQAGGGAAASSTSPSNSPLKSMSNAHGMINSVRRAETQTNNHSSYFKRPPRSQTQVPNSNQKKKNAAIAARDAAGKPPGRLISMGFTQVSYPGGSSSSPALYQDSTPTTFSSRLQVKFEETEDHQGEEKPQAESTSVPSAISDTQLSVTAASIHPPQDSGTALSVRVSTKKPKRRNSEPPKENVEEMEVEGSSRRRSLHEEGEGTVGYSKERYSYSFLQVKQEKKVSRQQQGLESFRASEDFSDLSQWTQRSHNGPMFGGGGRVAGRSSTQGKHVRQGNIKSNPVHHHHGRMDTDMEISMLNGLLQAGIMKTQPVPSAQQLHPNIKRTGFIYHAAQDKEEETRWLLSQSDGVSGQSLVRRQGSQQGQGAAAVSRSNSSAVGPSQLRKMATRRVSLASNIKINTVSSIEWMVCNGDVREFTKDLLWKYVYEEQGQKRVRERNSRNMNMPINSLDMEYARRKLESEKKSGGQLDQEFIRQALPKIVNQMNEGRRLGEALAIIENDRDKYNELYKGALTEASSMTVYPIEKKSGEVTAAAKIPGISSKKSVQPTNDLFDLLVLAQHRMPEMQQLFDTIAFETNAFDFDDGDQYRMKCFPSFKKLHRITEKVFRCYKMRYDHLTDVVRASLVYSTFQGLLDAVRVLIQICSDHDSGVRLTRIKNRLHPDFNADDSGGYRDMSCNIAIKSFICELQFHWKPMFDIKTGGLNGGEDSGHKRYIRFRNMKDE